MILHKKKSANVQKNGLIVYILVQKNTDPHVRISTKVPVSKRSLPDHSSSSHILKQGIILEDEVSRKKIRLIVPYDFLHNLLVHIAVLGCKQGPNRENP